MDWPAGVRLFELDLPETFAFKEPVLASRGASVRCARVVVGVDLGGDWVGTLGAVGFDAAAGTVWLAEGLLHYLDRVEYDRLLAAVTARSAPGSRFVFDHLDGSAADRPAMRETLETIRKVGGTSSPQWTVRWIGWRSTAGGRLCSGYPLSGGAITGRCRRSWI